MGLFRRLVFDTDAALEPIPALRELVPNVMSADGQKIADSFDGIPKEIRDRSQEVLSKGPRHPPDAGPLALAFLGGLELVFGTRRRRRRLRDSVFAFLTVRAALVLAFSRRLPLGLGRLDLFGDLVIEFL